MVTSIPLSGDFLASLIAEFAPGCLALGLTGSNARGDAGPESDVDLLRFLDLEPADESQVYRLFLREGKLVSVTATSILAKRAEMSRPERAIWAVPGLRQMRILYDPQGGLAVLQEDARNFSWQPLAPAAGAYASETVYGLAEEAHKILGALARRDESAALYGTYGMVLEAAKAVAVARGALIESENRFFEIVQQAASPAWAAVFRQAAGLDPHPTGDPPAFGRARAALNLYRETAALLSSLILPEHRPVIENALAVSLNVLRCD